MMQSTRVLSAVTPLALLGCASAEPVVTYEVDLSRARSQVVTISATAPVVDGSAEFVLPVWRPGRYGVLDFAATVREWSARDDSGQPLQAVKIRKNAWRIDTGQEANAVTLVYDIYANSLADRTRHVDDSHAFLSGSSVFVLSPAHRDTEHRVHFTLPEGWSVATGLEGSHDTFTAPGYDELMDSPFEIGQHQFRVFECDGVRTEVAVWGNAEVDWAAIEADFCAIAEATHAVFGGDIHFDRYLYIVHAYPGGRGGTEHLNSTVVQTSPRTFQNEDRYQSFLGLIAHEYFHTWNVKRFRPSGITPYDYDRENYTSLLWLVEGTTSYYDELLLVRAGIQEPDDYLRQIASSFTSVQDRPGRARSSLSQSRFDAWLMFWGPDSPDHANTRVNFYCHGAMASLALDLLIRGETEGKRSLDDVMRTLNARFDWRDRGYTPEDVRQIVAETAGTEMGWFFDRFIDGTEAPPMADALAIAGLEIQRGEGSGVPSLGLSTRWSDGGETVTSIADASPAFDAGVNVGDKILSLNDHSLEDRSLDDLIEDSQPGDEVILGIVRYGQLREIRVTLGPPQPGRYEVSRVASPTDSQRAVYSAWLGQAWPEEPSGDE